MIALLLAASSALLWGTGDFCGGKATQRAAALPVTLISQLVGVPVLVMCALLTTTTAPRPADLFWGAVAGAAGFIGIVLLYRGLAAGSMAIFAPVTAVTAAVVPLGVGLLLDKPPSAFELAGVGCAVVAIGLMSVTSSGGGDRSGRVSRRLLGLALAAGTLFGVFFAVLGKAGGPDSGLWPLVGVRAGSIGLGLVLVLGTRTSLRLGRPVLRLAAVAGSFDIVANALYLLAAQRGLLSIVAPIAALYPASTVLLALAVDRERIRPIQAAGLGLAATALVLVAT
ncbi:MAG TPA: EamA family transporter [Actinomycetes bacterium]|nr:EamA family transporter [Actinomycetes bacterium]